jgi:hypothetical protein
LHCGLLWLAFVVRNDWTELPVLLGLFVFGLGQGALVTLVFNVLVTAAPKELASDVGSLRGTTQNLAAAVGTAVAGALMVGLLSTVVMRHLAENPEFPTEIQAQLELDNINFVTNEQLLVIMERTTATPEQVEEAVRINTESRLRALKIGLLIMAGLAALTIIPAGRLPNYRPGEIPATPPMPSAEEERRVAREYERLQSEGDRLGPRGQAGLAAMKPRILVLSLGGTITMVPGAGGGIAPRLGAAELVASVPALADVAEIEAESPLRVASPSLTITNVVEVAKRIESAFADGADGAVVIQGTDTIEESAFLLDLLVAGDRPVVLTGAMRGADAPGADGPANLLAAARVAASAEARGLGTLVVLELRHPRGPLRPEIAHGPAVGLSLAARRAVGHDDRGAAALLRPRRAHALPSGRRWSARTGGAGQGGHGRRYASLRSAGGYGLFGGRHRGHGGRPCSCRRGPCARRSRRPVPRGSGFARDDRAGFHRHLRLPGRRDRPHRSRFDPGGSLPGLKARLLLGLILRKTRDRQAIGDAFAAYS